MGLSAHLLKQQFYEATHGNEELQTRPVYPVERAVFEHVTAPIKEFLKNDPVYSEYETGAAFQIENAMQLMQDAWVKEVNPEKGEMRDRCRNALQGIMETLRESSDDIVFVDYEDIFAIVKYREAINDAANIHERFMGNEAQANALRAFSDAILQAQNRLWTPVKSAIFDTSRPSANDEEFNQQIPV